jgi:hypothetical protein
MDTDGSETLDYTDEKLGLLRDIVDIQEMNERAAENTAKAHKGLAHAIWSYLCRTPDQMG